MSDDGCDRSLSPFSSQPWWSGFILCVQENQNLVSYLPETIPTDFPTRSLNWALTTSVDLLDTTDLARKEIILNYVTQSRMGVLKFCEIFTSFGTSLPIAVKISALLREFVNPRNGDFRDTFLRYLREVDTIPILMEMLEEIKKEKAKALEKDAVNGYHSVNVNTIWVLSALSPKNAKFAETILKIDKVRFVHDFIKKNFFHPKNEVHYPCLKILRALSRVSKVGHILAKDKFFGTLKRMMDTYLKTPSPKFQIILEILVLLTRSSKTQCKRFLKGGCLVTLMRVFNYWPVWKGRGLARMSKCVLNVYIQLASTHSGRKALIQSDAISSVRQFCEKCPKDKQFDDVIMRAFALSCLTYGKQKLPFKELSSPAKIEIGSQTEIKIGRDSGTSSDEDDPDDVEEGSPSTSRSPGDDDDDEDDDIEVEVVASDIELEDGNTTDESITESKVPRTASRPSRSIRTASIRKKDFEFEHYAEFFQELDCTLQGRLYCAHYNHRTYESIVVGLLGRFITKDVQGIYVPKAEFKYNWIGSKNYYYEGSISAEEMRKAYLVVSNQVRSVIPFVKVAYPELVFAYGGKRVEFTTPSTDRFNLRDKMIQLMQRTAAIGSPFKTIVVYDLDSLLHKQNQERQSTSRISLDQPQVKIGNDDELRVGHYHVTTKKRNSLKFESRFEGGNLRKAIQVGEREYDLYLMSDVNSDRHNQWFYFEVSNTPEDTQITFNIVNCIKTNSQFNFGMQPVVFSVIDALEGKPGWIRSGSNIMYYRNGYRNPVGKKRRYYYSASFTLHFIRKGDICYIAYHYPYSYSRLLTELWKMIRMAIEAGRVLVRYDMLCHSENENEVPLMTITAMNDSRYPIEVREVIFLSSRVHPGEPNSSWVMQGILHQLLFAGGMEDILKRYIFKIIPMLNVEGVINGCGRCGLNDEDLNRRWKDPDPIIHPSIYHTKGLISYCCKIRNKIPALYCDLHGHSRRKNVFFYGCSSAKSWSTDDRMMPEDAQSIQILPEAMARRAPAFSLSYCKFDIRKQRESTARVALWREFGITKSYTLESTYCGCDRGPYKGMSIGIGQLIEVGESLCEACVELFDPPKCSISMFKLPENWDEEIRNESKSNLNNDIPRYRSAQSVSLPNEPKKTKSSSTTLKKKKKKH